MMNINLREEMEKINKVVEGLSYDKEEVTMVEVSFKRFMSFISIECINFKEELNPFKVMLLAESYNMVVNNYCNYSGSLRIALSTFHVFCGNNKETEAIVKKAIDFALESDS